MPRSHIDRSIQDCCRLSQMVCLGWSMNKPSRLRVDKWMTFSIAIWRKIFWSLKFYALPTNETVHYKHKGIFCGLIGLFTNACMCGLSIRLLWLATFPELSVPHTSKCTRVTEYISGTSNLNHITRQTYQTSTKNFKALLQQSSTKNQILTNLNVPKWREAGQHIGQKRHFL